MAQFDYFVVLAEMRTGSNFLESNINAFDGLECHGEAYNPSFVGYPNGSKTLGISLEERNEDPLKILEKVKAAEGLNGFRYFNDHDPRVFDPMLADKRCAKIILTRNPVESYVSWKIAKSTGQWKLTDVKRLREDTISFNAEEFSDHINKLQAFQVRLLNTLQKSGQTAFYIDYEDLQDVEVMNGLASYLGIDERLEALDKSLKKQNPSSLSEKVENFSEMEAALARLDRFNLNRTPNFEPRRGPAVPSYIAASESPLMFMPIKSGPIDVVKDWLAGLDDCEQKDLVSQFTQKSLRQWKRNVKGHRSFAVVRHPVARVHAAFCYKILSTEKGSFTAIRNVLRKQFKLPIPAIYPDPAYGAAEHREAFLVFLKFVKSNLGGQTAMRVDAHWATQSQALQGFAEYTSPDLILREDRLEEDLAILASQVGKTTMPAVPEQTDPFADLLNDIYDADVEAAVYDVYQRDYIALGYGAYA
ncbi:sulfotransferase family 2 domain-containing protein [Octadecabacter ascidiaceicola]|uniref:Sulfotransferase family protein n=1 Tax=Octadecabacter ascidiaceicola TaxID=1655543 RepID=A0A238KF02_9RHOB|nr:sulfotransferase family 2 domain-containing protein [Octadecabacter ascidiaceicola]SMX41399.1 Sulfotransferase family protein [Octadecabacter ascidiaceicola]